MKPHAIPLLRSEKEEALVAFKAREKALATELRAAVPECFSQWLEEDTVVENLIEFGRASRKYRRSEGETYGYTDLNEFERRLFERLKPVWKGIVKIGIRWDGSDRIEVIFTAI